VTRPWSDRDTSDEVERLLPEVSLVAAASIIAAARAEARWQRDDDEGTWVVDAARPCHYRRRLLTMWHEGAHEVDREVEG
jgi:hypothetical protein